jgi:predicted house-cleaning NTP pyrophosphatase (Maf/HAM1 superfamily)
MRKLNPNEHVGMPNAAYHQFTQDSWSFDEIWQQYQEEEKAKKPMEELKQHPSGRSPQDSWPDDQTDVLMEEIWQKVDKEENGGRTRQQLESADGQHATTAIAFNKRQHPLNILKEKSVGFETNTKEHINEWASSASASASQSASWCGDIKFGKTHKK